VEQAQLLNLSTVPDDELEPGATYWHGRAAKALKEGCGEPAVTMFGDIARCYLEEATCRAAGVAGGVRAFVVDLGSLDDRAVQLVRAVAAVAPDPHKHVVAAVFDVVTRERRAQRLADAVPAEVPLQ
jgi:hypothetical protein